jgi:hypothetical protein
MAHFKLSLEVILKQDFRIGRRLDYKTLTVLSNSKML